MNDDKAKDLYFVAVKLFLRDGDKLLITHDTFGDWDIPGGRIRKNEFDVPLEDVVLRKVREELGDDFKYELGDPVVFFRFEREENSIKDNWVRIFAIGYEAKYEGGEIGYGDHHDKMEWVNVKTFKPEKYFSGGWLKGVEKYIAKVNR